MLTLLRRFALYLLSSMFISILLLASFFWTLNHTIADKEVVKSWLSGSQIYKVTVDSSIKYFDINKELSKDSSSDKSEEKDIDGEAVKAAITKALTPELLQNVAENILDGFYGWLNDENKKIEFSIDLTATKDSFIDGIVDYARNRVEPLPACTQQQLAGDPSVFTISCRPPASMIDKAEKELRKQLDSGEIFADTVITDETAFKSDSEKSTELRFDEKNSEVPYYFGLVKQVFGWLIILALALAVFIMFLGKTLRKGIGHVIKSLVIAAMIVGAGGVLINVGASSITTETFNVVNKTEASDKILPEIAVTFINYVGPRIASELFKPVIGYSAVALLLALLLVVLRKRNQKKEKAVPTESAPEDNKSEPAVEKAKETVQNLDKEDKPKTDTKTEVKPPTEPERKKPTPTISDVKPPKQ